MKNEIEGLMLKNGFTPKDIHRIKNSQKDQVVVFKLKYLIWEIFVLD